MTPSILRQGKLPNRHLPLTDIENNTFLLQELPEAIAISHDPRISSSLPYPQGYVRV